MPKQNKGFALILAVGIILVVSVLTAGGVLVYQQNKNAKEEAKKTENNGQKLIGGDKDEHGCLIAAGYSWCEAKNKCLRTWEEKCEKEITVKDETVDWKKYTNTQYGFEIKYPVNATISVDNKKETFWEYSQDEVAFNNVATINNDNGAMLSIYTGNDKKLLDNCFKFNFHQTVSDMTQKKEINSVIFYTGVKDDAAAGGQRGRTFQYSTIYNNNCYTMYGIAQWTDIVFVHGATDGKPAAQEEIDKQNKNIQEQTDIINKILSTFKFTK